jgi:uncharacterized protein with PIN domain
MRFLLDENLPRSAARILRDAGHDVLAVVESLLRGQKDPQLLQVSNDEDRIFITLDGGIRLTGGSLNTGAVLLRPAREFDAADVEQLLLVLISAGDLSQLSGHITVLSPGRIRRRTLS